MDILASICRSRVVNTKIAEGYQYGRVHAFVQAKSGSTALNSGVEEVIQLGFWTR